MMGAASYISYISGYLYLLAERIVFAPDADKLGQVMGSQDRRVPGQVVKAVHDDGHHNVEHNEATQKDETDEIEVGNIGATGFLGVHYFPGGFIELEGFGVALAAADARHHNVGPRLACRASKQHHESLENGPKVVVAFDG